MTVDPLGAAPLVEAEQKALDDFSQQLRHGPRYQRTSTSSFCWASAASSQHVLELCQAEAYVEKRQLKACVQKAGVPSYRRPQSCRLFNLRGQEPKADVGSWPLELNNNLQLRNSTQEAT